MKQSILAIAVLLFLLSTVATHAQEGSKKSRQNKSGGTSTVSLPYPVGYSSNFEMGKASNAKMILDLYKDYEKADWSKDSWFSDTVMVILPDGSVVQGKAQVLEGFKKNREANSTVEFKLDAVIPLRSVDRMEDWVALWGNEKDGMKDGSGSGDADFQAIWKIDASGKVAFVRIFQGKAPAMPQ